MARLHTLHKLFERTDSSLSFRAAAKARSGLALLERHHKVGQGYAASSSAASKFEMRIQCQVWTESLRHSIRVAKGSNLYISSIDCCTVESNVADVAQGGYWVEGLRQMYLD